ncbi:hypothetical protein HUJ05_004327 [Dendroctonus ponderosae]|nr:hypothetical protein HUJ05_004327 [Dendroctonus ponderosae]
MNNIMKFALYGVVHGDFKEFNIFITHYVRPVIMDFSHMIFTHHANVKMFFERDVNCVINFFKKRQVRLRKRNIPSILRRGALGHHRYGGLAYWAQRGPGRTRQSSEAATLE